MYFYESHLSGGIYSSEERIDWEYLYCDTCGDSDLEIGQASNAEELKKLLYNDYFYQCCDEYIDRFIKETFPE